MGGGRRSQYLRKEFRQRTIPVSLQVVKLDFVDIELCEQFFDSAVLNAPGKSPAAHDPHVDIQLPVSAAHYYSDFP
jgi:hypothetical protein